MNENSPFKTPVPSREDQLESLDNSLTTPKHDKPDKSSPQFIAEVCDLIANGENLRSIAKKTGIPRSTLCVELLKEENAGQYARSISLRADNRFEKLDETLDEMRNGTIDDRMARVIVDTYKWQCSKELPKKYGDRTDLNVGGQADNKLEVTVTFTGENKDVQK
jgi:hypothetical protein